MEIVRAVVVDCHIEDVFDYVADPLNDPKWCARVLAVDQLHGNGPGPGARYEILHRPSRRRAPRRMEHTCVGWDPPARLAWLDEDGADVFRVTYELEPVWTATRVTRRGEAHLDAPRLWHPLRRIGIGGDIARRLQSLKEVLERV